MDLVERVLKIRKGRSSTGRAPHKPLLLLYALGHYQRQGDTPIAYSAAETALADLIREYAPPNASGPAYPFHHLTNDDGLWVVRTAEGGGSPGRSAKELIRSGAAGRLGPEMVAALGQDPGALSRVVHALLEDNFPDSLHEELCQAVGLDLYAGDVGWVRTAQRRRRNREFRLQVLRAYEHQCAFCGYEGRLDQGGTVGLDAAHIRWFAFDGPDAVDNGVCLCSLHHVLFDKGVLGLGADLRVMVSAGFVGRTAAARTQVHDLAGREIEGDLHAGHLAWHGSQVFRGPARAA
ncbi:phosphorothioated DNA-binding restriction endonuclease [Acrocarpospora sp. B8E8]|uniref:phosphorothioated DNA-binding restriction endonuclease n=1 Tax=Acrocarpospora sp. B8E8 TaxID=3153572 RepID=UPI00325E26D1